MVNLNATQTTLKGNITREKTRFDKEWADETRRHKMREEELKRPVRAAIALADQSGVPQLQIAKAAGFNQINQLLNWMRDKTGGNLLASALSVPQRSLEDLSTEVTELSTPVFLEVQSGVWEASWGTQEPVRFTLYNYEGDTKVAVPDTEDLPDWFTPAVLTWNPKVVVGWPEDE